MIRISTNMGEVINITTAKLKSLADTDKMMREAATTSLALMKVRIHENGLDANNQQIGIYSPGYMVVRTGLKDKKVFKGKPKPTYNRTADPKVIASLTRQMENDEKVIAIKEGAYGIGFSNTFNFQKSQWVEATYKKRIFSLSPNEVEVVETIVKQHVADALS